MNGAINAHMWRRLVLRRGWTVGVIAVLIAPLAVVRAERAPVLPVRLAETVSDPVCAARLGAQDRSSLWAPPLDRIVNLRVPDVSLREALDRVAEEE